MTRLKRLDNGLKLGIVNLNSKRSFYVVFIVKAGSWWDLKGKAGVAHLVEHLVALNIERHIRASTGGEIVRFKTDDAIKIGDITSFKDYMVELAKVFAIGKFSQEQLIKEKKIVLAEARQRLEKSRDTSNLDYLQPIQFKQIYNYKQGQLAEAESIPRLNLKDIYRFYKKHYSPMGGYLFIGVPKGIETRSVEKVVKDVFSNSYPYYPHISRLQNRRQALPPPRFGKNEIFLKKEPLRQVYLTFSFPMPTALIKDASTPFLRELLFNRLGELDGEFMSYLRGDLGLIYTCKVSDVVYTTHPEKKLTLAITTYFDEKDVLLFLKHFPLALKRFIDNPIREEELVKYRNRTLDDLKYSGRYVFDTACYYLFNFGQVPDIEKLVKNITVGKVKRFTKKILNLNTASIAIVGKVGGLNKGVISELVFDNPR